MIWNLNRQIAFSFGAALLVLIFSGARHNGSPTTAWPLTFIISAALGLLPLLVLLPLTKQRIPHAN